jgi:hypothetical protein
LISIQANTSNSLGEINLHKATSSPKSPRLLLALACIEINLHKATSSPKSPRLGDLGKEVAL